MERSILASDIMTTNLVTLSPTMEVAKAIEILLKNRISGAPVVNDFGGFLGVFSEKSCIEFLLESAYDQVAASDLMPFVDTSPATILPDSDLLVIAETFIKKESRRLPVLDGETLVGQVSRRDVMRAFHDLVKAGSTPQSQKGLYLSALFDSSEARSSRLS